MSDNYHYNALLEYYISHPPYSLYPIGGQSHASQLALTDALDQHNYDHEQNPNSNMNSWKRLPPPPEVVGYPLPEYEPISAELARQNIDTGRYDVESRGIDGNGDGYFLQVRVVSHESMAYNSERAILHGIIVTCLVLGEVFSWELPAVYDSILFPTFYLPPPSALSSLLRHSTLLTRLSYLYLLFSYVEGYLCRSRVGAGTAAGTRKTDGEGTILQSVGMGMVGEGLLSVGWAYFYCYHSNTLIDIIISSATSSSSHDLSWNTLIPFVSFLTTLLFFWISFLHLFVPFLAQALNSPSASPASVRSSQKGWAARLGRLLGKDVMDYPWDERRGVVECREVGGGCVEVDVVEEVEEVDEKGKWERGIQLA